MASSHRRPFLLGLIGATGLAATSITVAGLASWPRTPPPGDPRWEMIRQRARAAKRAMARHPQVPKQLLKAEIELDAALAAGTDLETSGRALHALEDLLRHLPAPSPIESPDL